MTALLLGLFLATAPMATAAPVASTAAPAVQAGPRTIGVGDPLRRPLLDALRPAIQADLGQPVQFIVDRLRVQGDWAFLAGSVQRPDGRAIDFSQTRYAGALENGVFDGSMSFALLRRSGGVWRVVTFAIGPTDVVWLGWPDEHGAPMSLFE